MGEDLFGSTVLEKNKKYAEQVFQIQHYYHALNLIRFLSKYTWCKLIIIYQYKYIKQGAALVAVKCLNITEQSIVWKEKENTDNLEISNGAS